MTTEHPNALQAHLAEARTRLLLCLGVWLILVLLLWPLRDGLMAFFTQPFEGTRLMSIRLTELFFLNMKLVCFTALLATLPLVFYQVFRFCVPALRLPEKRWAVLISLMAITLFATGAMLAYWAVLPIVIPFFTGFQAEGVATMLTIGNAVGFVLRTVFVFGLAFLLPLLLAGLLAGGLVQRQSLVHKRSYMAVGCVAMAAILTPPDIISQLLLAVPLYMLFEVGLLVGTRLQKPQKSPTAS